MGSMLQAVRSRVSRHVPGRVRLAVRRFQFRGAERYCPICRSHVSHFDALETAAEVNERRKVVGAMRVPDDMCPICFSVSRQRLISLYLSDVLDLSGKRLLHMAPDWGLYFWLKGRAASYTSCDIDPSSYTVVHGVEYADIMAMPYPDDAFDVVLCSHILEHIPDDAGAIRELRRITADDGVVLLMVPEALDGEPTVEDPDINDPAEQERRFGQCDHVRIYARGDFVARLERNGFRVEEFDGYGQYPDRARELRLNPAERLWVAHPAG